MNRGEAFSLPIPPPFLIQYGLSALPQPYSPRPYSPRSYLPVPYLPLPYSPLPFLPLTVNILASRMKGTLRREGLNLMRRILYTMQLQKPFTVHSLQHMCVITVALNCTAPEGWSRMRRKIPEENFDAVTAVLNQISHSCQKD